MVVHPLQLQLLEFVCTSLCQHGHVISIGGNLLFIRLMVVIYPSNAPLDLVETNVIKTLEARPGNLFYPMVRYQKFLFPAHEHVLAVCTVFVVEICRFLCLFCKWPPRWETCPVFHVFSVRGPPIWMPSLEGVLRANYFPFEIGR